MQRQEADETPTTDSKKGQMMADETPLIYTKNGNVPESTTIYSHKWLVTEELITFAEEWHDRDSGELVKNSVHCYMPKGGPAIGGQQAQIA